VVAASSETVRLLELFQLQNDQGPCLDCFRVGRPVVAAGLAAEAWGWPRFAAAARQAGFAAVQALPMRLRDQVIGALNLFRAVPGAFNPAGIHIGQALADVAAISLLHERSMRHSDTLNEQLQTALNSRVIIEQAKGKLAERLGLDMNQAFNVLRNHARARSRRLSGTWPRPSPTAQKPSPARPRARPAAATRHCAGTPSPAAARSGAQTVGALGRRRRCGGTRITISRFDGLRSAAK
jgi:ANTAR domain/GAF domain